jgi:hypothetical protein
MSAPAAVYLRFAWRCTCCGAEGEIRCAPTVSCDRTERLIADDHRRTSPMCPKLRYTVKPLETEYVYPPAPPGALALEEEEDD